MAMINISLAAYKNQGIDIEQKGLGSGPGITPMMLEMPIQQDHI
jgi:hypothetical protein